MTTQTLSTKSMLEQAIQSLVQYGKHRTNPPNWKMFILAQVVMQSAMVNIPVGMLALLSMHSYGHDSLMSDLTILATTFYGTYLIFKRGVQIMFNSFDNKPTQDKK